MVGIPSSIVCLCVGVFLNKETKEKQSMDASIKNIIEGMMELIEANNKLIRTLGDRVELLEATNNLSKLAEAHAKVILRQAEEAGNDGC